MNAHNALQASSARSPARQSMHRYRWNYSKRHPRRAAIELAVARGEPMAQAGEPHGLSKWVVLRHWQSHVSEAQKAALRLGSEVNSVNLPSLQRAMRENSLPDLLALKGRVWAALDAAREAKDLKATSSLLGRAIDLQELIEKITVTTRADAGTVSEILQIDLYASLRSGILQALRQHPEARATMLDFLRNFDDRLAAIEGGAPVLEGVVSGA